MDVIHTRNALSRVSLHVYVCGVYSLLSSSLLRYRHDVMEALHSLEKCVRELKEGLRQSAPTDVQ